MGFRQRHIARFPGKALQLLISSAIASDDDGHGRIVYALTTSSDPGMAIAADRNPWLSNPLIQIFTDFILPPTGTPEQQINGNSTSHREEGQNVLFLDSHVCFEKRSYCAIEDDNIYTSWTTSATNPEKRKGVQTWLPRDRKRFVTCQQQVGDLFPC